MKGIGILAFGAWSAGLAVFSGSVAGGEVGGTVPSSEITEAPAAEPALRARGFTGEELLRLRELRAWLVQRRLQREHGAFAGPQRRPLDLAVYPERQLLTPLGQRYALGFQDRGAAGSRGNHTLYIGRGPDGRIYHRYEFEAAPARPEGIPAQEGITPLRGLGAGNPATRRRVVRFRAADSTERYAAPPSAYESR